MHALHYVRNHHLDPELVGNMARDMFGAVHRAMLSARTTETYLYMLKPTLLVVVHHHVHNGIDILEEGTNLALLFEKTNHRLVVSA